MKPFKMWVGGVTMYSSNQMSPSSSVKTTPPSRVDLEKLTKARVAASRYSDLPVSCATRTSKEIPCPWASPEYQGAFNGVRYSQSKRWFHTGTPKEFGSRRFTSQSAAARDFLLCS